MTCSPGNHEYQPFARSRDLFCRFCGDVVEYRPSRPNTKIQNRIHVPRAHDAPLPPAGNNPDPDPDLDAAQAILAQKTAIADVEQRVEAILNEHGIGGEEAERYIRDVLAFGPEIDLDYFAQQMGEIARKRDAAAHASLPLED